MLAKLTARDDRMPDQLNTDPVGSLQFLLAVFLMAQQIILPWGGILNTKGMLRCLTSGEKDNTHIFEGNAKLLL